MTMEISGHKLTELRNKYPKYRVTVKLTTQEDSWSTPPKTLDSVMATTLDKKAAEEFFEKIKRGFR